MAPSDKRFFRFGRFRLHPEGSLLRDDVPVPITPKTFQTLLFLVENHGRVVERDELIRRVWPDTVVEEGNLSFQVHQVRKALGGDGEEFIATVPRRGYRFVCPVTETAGEPEVPSQAQETAATNVIAGGGENAAQGTPPPIRRPSWAGSRLWVAALVGLVVIVAALRYFTRGVPASGSTAPAFAALTGAQGYELDPSFSPDGGRLAYVWQQQGQSSQVYVRPLDSPESRQLTVFPSGSVDLPRWSPDGKHIAFIRGSGSLVEIFAVDAAGGNPRFVAQPTGAGPIYGFDWSPDGQLFAFSRSSRAGAPSAVFLLRRDTGEQTQITNPEGVKPAYGDRDLAFSPDGRTLAFVRYEDFTADIYRVPTAGGELQRLTSDKTAVLGLDWTSDGRDIVFASRRAGTKGSLWRIAASGGKAALVTSSQLDVRSPVVARRGDRLAFAGFIGDHNIWQMPIDRPGGGEVASMPVIDWPGIDAGPDVSPDGAHVAFMSNRSGSVEIWYCTRAGDNCTQLTAFGGPHTGVPRWSPDGRWLAIASRPQGNDDVYLVNLRRDEPRRLTQEPSDDTVPSWSRSGQWVYFSSDRTGRFEIWKAPVNGQAPVQVTRNGGFASSESPDGRFLFYTKRNAPGLWQMPIDGGDETLILRDDPSALNWGYWSVSDRTIYFVKEHGRSRAQRSLEAFDLSTRQARSIAPLALPPGPGGPGLSLTPDGRHVLISLVQRTGSNIMLAENFF